MNFDLEGYIIDNIDNGNWKVNERIPTEVELIKTSGLSKMSIRKVVSKLSTREIVYTIPGSGVFVSPFNKMQRFNSDEDEFGATKITYLPTNTKLPKHVIQKFDESVRSKFIPKLRFVKLYFKEEEAIAYSIGWINNTCALYNFKDLAKGRYDLMRGKYHHKTIKMTKMEPATKTDISILHYKEGDYVPTTYSYYVTEKREMFMVLITKTKPIYFDSFEIEYR